LWNTSAADPSLTEKIRWTKLIDEICALLGCYAESNDSPLPTFRDNLSVSSSRVKKSKKESVSCQARYAVRAYPYLFVM
jgi:hypothetical protein